VCRERSAAKTSFTFHAFRLAILCKAGAGFECIAVGTFIGQVIRDQRPPLWARRDFGLGVVDVLPNVEVETRVPAFWDCVLSVDPKLDRPRSRSIHLPDTGEITDKTGIAFVVVVVVNT
jgi:hypothetical protein